MTDSQPSAPQVRKLVPVPERFQGPVAFVVILLSGVLGSVTSALVIVLAAFGWLRLLPARGSITLPRPVYWTSMAFVAFFLAEALAAVVNWHGEDSLREIGENFVFLGMLPLFLLLSADRRRLLDFMLMAAPGSAFIALAVALVQRFGFDLRSEGGSGNAAVFAVMVAILYAFNLASLMRGWPKHWYTYVATAGVAASAAALILSETRSMWPCLVVFPVLMWLATRKAVRMSFRPVAIALVGIVLLGVALSGTIQQRYDQAMAEFAAAQDGKYQSSIGKRFVMWEIATKAIAERPILGHGPDTPPKFMQSHSELVNGRLAGYTHFHNTILNEMVRAGIVGTLALAALFVVPLGFSFVARRGDTVAATGFGLLLCFHGAFLLSGSVGIMLDHDLMDTQFTALTALCLYFLFAADGDAAEPGERGA